MRRVIKIGVKGLKTGYTPEAGLTLVTLAEKEGREVLGVLLNSENRREEARQLLDYSFTFFHSHLLFFISSGLRYTLA